MVESQPNTQMIETTKADPSQGEIESHSYGSERAAMESPPKPKTEMFVPINTITEKPQKKGQNEPLFLARRLTLQKDQIERNLGGGYGEEEHNTLLDCILCKNIMVTPKECNNCCKGFCKKCINDYIQDLMAGGYDITCPNCGCENFKPKEPHPLVTKTLNSLKVLCMNKAQGCTAKIPYLEMSKHMIECDYATMKCTNYGCEKEMFKKDYKVHSETCEFRVRTCQKCDFILPDGLEECDDCIPNMKKRFENLESKYFALIKKVNDMQEKAEKPDPMFGNKWARVNIDLPALQCVKFNPQFGWSQTCKEVVVNLPPNMRALIVKFGLTDINVRSQYNYLKIYQKGAKTKIDLT